MIFKKLWSLQNILKRKSIKVIDFFFFLNHAYEYYETLFLVGIDQKGLILEIEAKSNKVEIYSVIQKMLGKH